MDIQTILYSTKLSFEFDGTTQNFTDNKFLVSKLVIQVAVYGLV